MLTEAMLALATAGGTAVVQAAGTEAWGSVSEGVARIFRRRAGDGAEDGAQRELERTALVLASDEADGSSRQASLWGQRFAILLSDADEQSRQQAEAELRQLISLARGAADQYQVLNIHDNTYENSPQQYGSGSHQRFHYGSDT